MTPIERREFLGRSAALAAGCFVAPALAAEPPKALVNGQPQAATTGNAVLAAGGNAVDAVVSAALVAGVVAVHSTGIGSYGGHMVIAKPDGRITAIDFNSTAPAAAKADMFTVDEKGVVKDRANAFGWLAAGVPGALAGLQLALDKFGTKKFAELVKPAIRYARGGFPVVKGLATAIKTHQERFAKDLGSAKLFFNKGDLLAEGATFRNPDLADLLQALADKGRVDDFYKGKIAEKIAAGFKKNGGLVTADDLAAYKAVEVTPSSIEWKGHTIYTPPPTSGGLTVLQMLAMLKALGWPDDDAMAPPAVQTRVEAMRLAWGDRLRRLGDPKYADVPVNELLSEKSANAHVKLVQLAVQQKKPVEVKSDGRPAGGTIHLNAVDSSGMMVALTFTHGNAFGAQVTVDGLGLILGHGMSRFDPRTGRPNSPGPGKKPLHNMCPTVVSREGKPVLTIGATGGRKIVNTVCEVLAHRLGTSRTLAEAVKTPRVHTEGDLSLLVEKDWPAAVVDRFKEAGYTVKEGTGANLSAIERDSLTGELRAAAR
jgi:gamma-glutamyltranspeptidase / glutathione hydrolase